MANVVPDSFKTDLLKGTFNFDSSGGSTFKLICCWCIDL